MEKEAWGTIGEFTFKWGDIDRQQVERLKQIHCKFDKKTLHTIVEPLIEKHEPVSLRIVDWAAVNYSKQSPVEYVIMDSQGSEIHWSMHYSYKTWLRNYRRRCFDIFRRRSRIYFKGKDNRPIATTVAQLNFLFWMIIHDVVNWCSVNKEKVERNMINTLTKSKSDRIANKRKKRSELVKASKKTSIVKQSRKIVFDPD
mgnify:CR=1 FL=1